MKLGILTSVQTRHRYFVNRLCSCFDVRAVVYETIAYAPENISPSELTVDEQGIVDRHFEDRACQEERFFGGGAAPIEPDGDCMVLNLAPGLLNDPDTMRSLDAAGVDAVVVFGTNLITAPLLNRFPHRMLNMHLGLSPYYRGTATNFYPLLNDEPEYVGATIHLLDAGIDTGPILRHARPAIVADDGPHTIGCKAIESGIDAMIDVLADFQNDRMRPVSQWPVDNPRLCLRRDYDVRQVVELHRKLDAGLIPRYVERASRVRTGFRLME